MFLRTKPLIKSILVSCNSRHWVIFKFLPTSFISSAGSGKSIMASTLICRFNSARTMGTFTTAPVSKASIGTGSLTQSAKLFAVTLTHFALAILGLASIGAGNPFLPSNMEFTLQSGLASCLAALFFKQLKL